MNAKPETVFQELLSPLVNLEYTLLLFATFVFHHRYFAGHAVANLLALDGTLLAAVYIYGAIVLLASLVKIPSDWEDLVTLIVFIGNALICIAYTALFLMRSATPCWKVLLAQFYYLLQGILSLVLVILLLTRQEGERFYVAPRLGGVPTRLKALVILAYAVGMTVFLHHGLDVAPDVVTAQVNLVGALLLETLARLT
jgi:hypothetical protein